MNNTQTDTESSLDKVITARLVSKEDLKLKKAPNKIATLYNILFLVPVSWLDSPIIDSFVAANFINNETFRALAFYSGVVHVKDIVNNKAKVQFSVEESYINNFYNEIRKLPEDAQIIIEQERGS